MLCFICFINIQRRELNFGDSEKIMVKVGLCLDAYELIYFKLSVLIDMTEPYILIPVWITLTFTRKSQGYVKARTSAVIVL